MKWNHFSLDVRSMEYSIRDTLESFQFTNGTNTILWKGYISLPIRFLFFLRIIEISFDNWYHLKKTLSIDFWILLNTTGTKEPKLNAVTSDMIWSSIIPRMEWNLWNVIQIHFRFSLYVRVWTWFVAVKLKSFSAVYRFWETKGAELMWFTVTRDIAQIMTLHASFTFLNSQMHLNKWMKITVENQETDVSEWYENDMLNDKSNIAHSGGKA